MSEKTIFVEIFQPFAQYRNPFTFYYAQTYPLPPKSTIIGMLQNSVEDWYGNKYGIETWWNLKVSVHGGFESIFWNYQQLIKGDVKLKKFGNKILLFNQNLPLYGEFLISQRSPVSQQEMFNGHLYLFVRGEEEIINKIKESLKKPSKILYLGRSEDIIFIRNVIEVESEEKIVESDIKLKYPTYILEEDLPISANKYPLYSIPTKILFENNGNIIKHKVEINKETKRIVEFKRVIYTGYDYSLIIKENSRLTVEFFKIGNKEIRILHQYGWL